ncbi:MAG: beta-ketoacyl-ACP synthase II [Chloroflexi bacterium]|nr:beta-ketoacyl-ACP synthase II [Chloroflexota bacterium]MCY3695797.1 beta-ketoacyl-ACP synthase II [Chloroflexota bacterium]MXX79681.1 beta-ketoacyl-ACP synthase II [Chloroflexota bacterium]MYF22505.1 beta-ketoacyl-ACP synthase II [Chloroflexota bacterium]
MTDATAAAGGADRPRVVVSGLGAVSPYGPGVGLMWDKLLAGESAIKPIENFDISGFSCTIGGEIRDFEPRDFIDRKSARRMARFTQFAVAAAREAIEDAQLDLDSMDRSRIGVVLGNGAGGYPEIQATASTLFERGGMRLDPLFLPKVLPNMAAANIAMQFGLLGYNTTVVTACAAGTQALGDAANVIRNGQADIVISGGTEAGFCQLGLGGFAVMRALSTQNEHPTEASRPFDADRDGFVPGEGAGIIVLESEESARRRGVDVQVELAGFGSSADAHHLVMPDADGAGPIRAIQWAMEDAAVAPEEIDYINAHGTSTPLNDASETRAIKAALGESARSIPISSTKSMIGHIFGGAGGLESIAAIKSITDGRIHPTINYSTPDPDCDLDYVPNKAIPAEVSTVLKNSFGFGGQNACLVFRRLPNS